MIDGISEQELRQHVANARLRPESDERDARIYRALRRVTDSGSVFYVLADTPEQYEDVFGILVDDRMIVSFELARDDPEALPEDIDQCSVEEYRETFDDEFEHAKLRIALELARRDLGR